jgi:hypothetical protein
MVYINLVKSFFNPLGDHSTAKILCGMSIGRKKFYGIQKIYEVFEDHHQTQSQTEIV